MRKEILSLCWFMLTFTAAYGFQTKSVPGPPAAVPLAGVLKMLGSRYDVNFLYEESSISHKMIAFDPEASKRAKLKDLLTRILTPLALSWYPIDNKNYAVYPLNNKDKTGNTLHKLNSDTLSNGKITGQVLNEQHRPQSFSTVSLLKLPDSAVVANVLSDTAGNYMFLSAKADNYIVRATLLGYYPVYSGTFQFNADSGLTLGPLIMKVLPHALKEVQITVSRPLVETKNDRFILNVGNSAMAVGNSIQLLKSAPFVSISADNSISLQGKKTMILIDNKPVLRLHWQISCRHSQLKTSPR